MTKLTAKGMAVSVKVERDPVQLCHGGTPRLVKRVNSLPILFIYRRKATLNVKYCTLLSLTAFLVTGSAPKKTTLYRPEREINPAGTGRCNSCLTFAPGTANCYRTRPEASCE